MTTEPGYTPARHRLLAEVARGGMKVYVGLQWSLMRGDEFLVSNQQRVARSLRNVYIDRLPGRMNSASQAYLTGGGRVLLAKWTAKHGNPLSDQGKDGPTA